jgi:DNA-binding CsgD family transcriptional regulator
VTRNKLGSAHLFLLAKQPSPAARTRETGSEPPPAPRPSDRPSQPPQEIVLDGRKYRLVPVDGDDPSLPPPPLAPRTPSPSRVPLGELLTARELQIVALVAEGRPNKQIASELHISEWTVSTHLRRIYAKLDVDSRAAMVTRCFDALSAGAPESRP